MILVKLIISNKISSSWSKDLAENNFVTSIVPMAIAFGDVVVGFGLGFEDVNLDVS